MYCLLSIIASELLDFPRKFSQLSRIPPSRPLYMALLDTTSSYRASHSLVVTHPSDGLSAAQRCQRELVSEGEKNARLYFARGIQIEKKEKDRQDRQREKRNEIKWKRGHRKNEREESCVRRTI